MERHRKRSHFIHFPCLLDWGRNKWKVMFATRVELVSDTQLENFATKLPVETKRCESEAGRGEIETQTIGGPGLGRSRRPPSPVTDGASANGTRYSREGRPHRPPLPFRLAQKFFATIKKHLHFEPIVL